MAGFTPVEAPDLPPDPNENLTITNKITANTFQGGTFYGTFNGTLVGLSGASVGSAGIASTAIYAGFAGVSTSVFGGSASVTNLIVSGISTLGMGTTSSPSNSQLSFELINNTNLRIKVRGSDGVLRSANITLS